MQQDLLNDPRTVRELRGETQAEFYSRLGLSQSCGSRYEQGRPMPEPIRMLFGAVYLGAKLPVAGRLPEKGEGPA